jgi:tetratricopeptide (TPR) repeat protein
LLPEDATASLQRIESLLSLDRNSEARDLLTEVAERADGSVGLHDRIGRLFTGLQMHEQALIQYEKARDAEPDNPSSIYNVATAQRFLGQLDEAERSLDKALELNPYDFEAQAMRSSLRKQRTDSNHVAELTEILEDEKLATNGAANICYALAKEYDDLDEPAKSFDYLQRGASARRRGMTYQVETDLEIMAAIQNSYDAQFFEDNHYGDNSDEPIFVIGMPRTGTTLVERILGTHSEVHSAGELDNFGREVMRQLGEQSDPTQLSRQQVVEKCAELNFARIGRDYVSSTRPLTGATPHFIDKLPFNYLYVGLIHVALPNARIINLTRHPMATCYAVYKQFFRDAYPFSYDLNELARYYVAYHKLMAHWHTVLPGAIHTVAYEDLVTDVEGEARRLLDFCGLAWESQVLSYYENRQASTTASASQVRQPVYTTSIDRWRIYSDQLRPVADILGRAGIDFSA